jgi:hypothetical protein
LSAGDSPIEQDAEGTLILTEKAGPMLRRVLFSVDFALSLFPAGVIEA